MRANVPITALFRYLSCRCLWPASLRPHHGGTDQWGDHQPGDGGRRPGVSLPQVPGRVHRQGVSGCRVPGFPPPYLGVAGAGRHHPPVELSAGSAAPIVARSFMALRRIAQSQGVQPWPLLGGRDSTDPWVMRELHALAVLALSGVALSLASGAGVHPGAGFGAPGAGMYRRGCNRACRSGPYW